MTPQETARMMTYLAATCAPVPEGDDWRAALEAWADVFADTPLGDMQKACRAHVKDTRPGLDGRPRGGWWPRPADLLALIRPVEMTNEAAWAHLRPRLADRLDTDGLTPTQASAAAALPGGFDRARMSSAELDRLRGRFLAGCQAAEARAANPTPATVIPLRPEPPRLVETPPPQQMPAKGRRSAAEPAAMGEPTPRQETRQNGPARPADGACAMPAGMTEAEMRQRARGKVDEVRARFGGGR